jgi:glycosyltransferase involved in cell wall biosynthesis
VEVSVVLPTFNRADALRRHLPALLGLEGVDEVVVVDDGSTDGTRELLASQSDRRLRIVRLAANAGAPAARNAGAAAARGSWLLFGEDDCRFPPEFARVLREEADAHGADAVGAPMVHPAPEEPLATAVAAARARGWRQGVDHVAGFPPGPVITPILPAPSLVRRELVLRLGFDEGYRGNAYREETDFFLRATRAGALCVLTDRTFFWEPRRWRGGQAERSSRTAAELWTLRNNWRFLRRHGQWLAETGHIGSPLGEQTAFVGRRLRRAARAGLSATARRARQPLARTPR